MKGRHLFTSESVAEGHPDKLSDVISDSILDAIIKQDPNARVACETYITMGLVIIGGEITTNCYVDVHKVARDAIKEVGYDHPRYGFDYKTCTILNAIHAQSPDIAQGVDTGGAGDQGMMFGFACNETPELMPLPIMLAHKIVDKLAKVRKTGELKYLGPDGKSQVTVEYDGNKPIKVTHVVIATQHTEDILRPDGKRITDEARQELIDVVIKPALGKWLNDDIKYFVNETGKFVIGGPQSDTGMTGRKIVVDSYGGSIAVGGGAFSGKDPSKVDRSAAYMARYIAKNIVAAGLAERCTMQLAYCIGVAEPISILAYTEGTGKIPDEKLVELIKKNFKLTPKEIIQRLKLRNPIYKKTACHGHFGRTEDGFEWEKTDMAETLRKSAKLNSNPQESKELSNA